MKYIFVLCFLFSSKNCLSQEKFDYTVYANSTGIVVYKLLFDSSKLNYDSKRQLAIEAASNIYMDNKCYPIASLGAIQPYTYILFDSIYGGKYSKLLDTIKSLKYDDFMSSMCFSDISIFRESKNENSQYYFGGEQYIKNDSESEYYRKKGFKLFYVAYKFTADILSVCECNNEPFYMETWTCDESHSYSTKKNGYIYFLLKLKNSEPLNTVEIENLKLIKTPKFGYFYSGCY